MRKFEPGSILVTSDAKTSAGIISFPNVPCPCIPHRCQGLIVTVLLFFYDYCYDRYFYFSNYDIILISAALLLLLVVLKVVHVVRITCCSCSNCNCSSTSSSITVLSSCSCCVDVVSRGFDSVLQQSLLNL